ncbi:MAG: ABC transporter ATP-binding protein [Alphaproteobacteria bacterium]|nr:ABC transporter ATP-binding protein [Alphaproteobacteria bacterium]
MTAPPLLQLRDLSVDFSTDMGIVHAVDRVSFDIGTDEIVALVGESGSGKSVIAQAIMGLLGVGGAGRNARTSGQLRFRGRDGAAIDLLTLDAEERRRLRGRDIGMVFQEPMTALNPVLTVGEQIAELLRVHAGLTRAQAAAEAVARLAEVGIAAPAERAKSYPHQMSGGMRQRVLIAIAMACQPLLLIADEPTTALDVTVQAQILELMRTLKRRTRMSVLFITHDFGIVAELADRVVVLYAGRMVEEGSATDIFASPRHPYTEGLLGAVPRLDLASDTIGAVAILPGTAPDPLAFPAGCRFHPRCTHARPGLCDGKAPAMTALAGARRFACHVRASA